MKPENVNEQAIRHFASFLLEKVPAKTWEFSTVAGWRGHDKNGCGNAQLALATLDPDCGAVGCAIGHAGACFGLDPYGGDTWSNISLADALGIDWEDSDVIFGCHHSVFPFEVYGKNHDDVTPRDVAKALLRYLDEGPWWWHS